MSKPYLPAREPELLAWTQAFMSLISNDAAGYGLTPDQAMSFAEKQSDFATAYGVTQNRTTRTPASIEAKNNAKKELIAETRRLVKIIQASPVIDNDKRAQLGITIPDTDPTPVPARAAAKQVEHAGITVDNKWDGEDFVQQSDDLASG